MSKMGYIGQYWTKFSEQSAKGTLLRDPLDNSSGHSSEPCLAIRCDDSYKFCMLM